MLWSQVAEALELGRLFSSWSQVTPGEPMVETLQYSVVAVATFGVFMAVLLIDIDQAAQFGRISPAHCHKEWNSTMIP